MLQRHMALQVLFTGLLAVNGPKNYDEIILNSHMMIINDVACFGGFHVNHNDKSTSENRDLGQCGSWKKVVRLKKEKRVWS